MTLAATVEGGLRKEGRGGSSEGGASGRGTGDGGVEDDAKAMAALTGEAESTKLDTAKGETGGVGIGEVAMKEEGVTTVETVAAVGLTKLTGDDTEGSATEAIGVWNLSRPFNSEMRARARSMAESARSFMLLRMGDGGLEIAGMEDDGEAEGMGVVDPTEMMG